jgi:hypothetical protein
MSESWQVVGQRQTTVQSPSGGFEDAMLVSFKTSTGIQGSVTVPLSQYTADSVSRLISERVTAIEQVNASGPGTPSMPSGGTPAS